jgi:hypothetical protein
MSEIYSAKRVVDKTAPWGRPEGVVLGDEVASFRCTVKEHPSRYSLKMKRRYVGSWKTMSL